MNLCESEKETLCVYRGGGAFWFWRILQSMHEKKKRVCVCVCVCVCVWVSVCLSVPILLIPLISKTNSHRRQGAALSSLHLYSLLSHHDGHNNHSALGFHHHSTVCCVFCFVGSLCVLCARVCVCVCVCVCEKPTGPYTQTHTHGA